MSRNWRIFWFNKGLLQILVGVPAASEAFLRTSTSCLFPVSMVQFLPHFIPSFVLLFPGSTTSAYVFFFFLLHTQLSVINLVLFVLSSTLNESSWLFLSTEVLLYITFLLSSSSTSLISLLNVELLSVKVFHFFNLLFSKFLLYISYFLSISKRLTS